MAKPEVRMSEGTAAFLVVLVVAALVGAFTNWYGFGAKTTSPTTGNVVDNNQKSTPLQLIPAIEKTKVYVSTFDQADFTVDGQNNRVAGTMDLIKSGVDIDTVTTLTTGAAASTSEFNGGDQLLGLGAASGYYANPTELQTIGQTLQPVSVYIKKQGAPAVYLEDDKQATITTLNLSTNEVSKTMTIVIERPGDRKFYQFCGIAALYNDKALVPKLKQAGSFVDGTKVFDPLYNVQDAAGYTAVWAFDQPIKNFDSIKIDYIVGTKKDVVIGAQNITFQVFDCESNLQNGKVVYTSEDSANVDVGMPNIDVVQLVN